MKGKDKFTLEEVEMIIKLIKRKVVASKFEQRAIRDEIRSLGFYFSDFSSKKGYTVADFESLILSGQIKIVDGDFKPTTSDSKVNGKNLSSFQSLELNSLLQILKQNRFDPSTDNELNIPDKSGNYLLCLRDNSELPKVSITPSFNLFEGLKVIYTGIAGGSLRSRDYRQRFKGNNAGRSTLRKSLGVLFGYKQIPRDVDAENGKTKFDRMDEIKLTDWMINNLIMFYIPTTDFDTIELKLINHFNPPLNLKDNHNSINSEFRKLLSRLRSEK